MFLFRKFSSPIPFSIWAMGVSSMLLNISTVMVFGVVALYMKQILGAATGVIILLEGFFEAMAFAMKLISGVLSDYLRRRKPIMLWGVAMITLAKPMFAIFASIPFVICARLLDRVGNGVQSTPRDALVGDLAPEHMRGASFGLRQSFATAGSFLGGIIGIVVMTLTHQNIQYVFMLASIPALLALLLIAFFVQEKPKDLSKIEEPRRRQPLNLRDMKRLGKSYWFLMIVVLVFMSARIGESMLVLHATHSFGMDQSFAHAILILYNCTNSLFSYPVGLLSDRMGRYGFLALSFALLIVADLFLAFSPSLTWMLVGVGLWGIQIGMSQDMFLCLIADQVPKDLRGTGIGFFYLINSVALLMAGFIGGFLADRYDQFTTFMGSGVIAALALVLLMILRASNKLKEA